MQSWLAEQADFLRFSYGLTFVLAALTCGLVRPGEKLRFPWRWFALFAAAHGLYEWAGLVPRDSVLFSGTEWVAFILWIVSFIALGAFALEGNGRARAAAWSAASLLPGAAALPWGPETAKAVLCVSLVLPAAGVASVRLLKAWWHRGDSSAGLWWAGVGVLAFGIFSALVPPHAPFFPASLWNEAAFFRLTGVPVWVPRGGAAAAITTGLWLHVRENVREMSNGAVQPPPAWLGAVFLVIVACGWALTEGLGRFAAERTRLEAGLMAECVAHRWTALAEKLGGRVRDVAQAAWARDLLSAAPARRGPAKTVGVTLLDAKGRPAAGEPLPPPSSEGLWSGPAVEYWIGRGERICARAPVRSFQGALLGYAAACAPLVEPGTDLPPGTALVFHRNPSGPLLDTGPRALTASALLTPGPGRVEIHLPPTLVRHYRLFGIGLTLLACVFTGALYVVPERRRAAARLREASEQRLLALLEASPDPIVVFGRSDRRIRWVNRAVEGVFRIPAAEFPGADVTSFLASGIPWPELERALAESGGGFLCFPAQRRDGSRIWLEASTAPVEWEGEPCLVATVRDVTERVRAEETLHRQEALLATVLENTDNGILVLAPDRRIRFHNRKYLEIWNIPEGIIQGNTTLDDMIRWACRNGIYAPEREQEILARRLQDLESSAPNRRLETRRVDGRRVEGFSTRLPDGGYLLWFRDVTEHEITVQALRDSEQRYRSIMEALQDPVYVASPGDRIEYMNPAMVRRIGRDATGEPCFSAVHGLLERCPWCPFGPGHPGPGKGPCEIISPLDGRTFEATAAPLALTEGAGARLVILRDVTEQRSAEEVIRAQKEFADRLILNSAVASFVLGPDHTVILWNRACEALTGIPAGRIVGTREAWKAFFDQPRPTLADLVLDGRTDHLARYYDDWSPSVLAPEGVRAERWYRDAAGRERYLIFDAVPIRDHTGRLVAALETIQDITEQKRFQARLSQLGAAVEQAAEAVVVFTAEGRVEYANPSFERITGFSVREALDRRLCSLLTPSGENVLPEILEAVRTRNQVWTGRRSLVREDGGRYEAELSVSPVTAECGEVTHFVLILRDITREMESEQHLRHAQKLEALGTLASGIAHDFNNILTALVGYAEMALDDVPARSQAAGNLKRILAGAERAQKLIRQLLAFGRQIEDDPRRIDLGTVVEESLRALRAGIPPSVDMVWRNETLESPIVADPNQIHQVVMNLVTNAVHAVGNEGTIEITLSATQVDRDMAERHPDLAPGSYFRLTVTDDGCGIPPEILGRIFDPFFTTKPVGEGSGLGLAAVHGIVRAQRGAVIVHSRPGAGTTFHVFLPRADPQAVPGSEAPRSRGGERILLVDDEPEVLEVEQQVLENLGYHVEACPSAREALRRFRARPEEFDLLFTDQSMPGMSGLELASALRALRPDLPVVLCTGFERRSTRLEARELGIDQVVLKPVSVYSIGEAVRKALDRRVVQSGEGTE